MTNILKILQLIRYKNLIFIAFIQYLMHETIFLPIIQKPEYGFAETLSGHILWLLILSTVLIAAGGYVLNDYFDYKIDKINHPDKQIIGTYISKQTAMLLHQILTFGGTIAGLALSWYARSFTLAFIFVVVPGLLWFYSASYKRQFLIGNLTVSFVSGLSVLVVAIFGLAFMKKEYSGFIYETTIPSDVQGWIGAFALFAFLLTFIREIIKDMEDEHGDRELECRTMPIVWGIAKTKIFVVGLIALAVTLLLVANYNFIHFDGSLTIKYISSGIILPLIILSYLVIKAKSSQDFQQAAAFSKFIMLTGVLYSFVFYYLMAKLYGLTLFNIFVLK